MIRIGAVQHPSTESLLENFDVDEEFSGNVRFVGEEEGEMLFVER